MNTTRVNVRETAAIALIIASVGGLACLAWWLGRATPLEAISFVTGAFCVWLTVKQNVWNFPIGLLNVATFGIVFYQSRLYADAGLQAVFFVLGLMGWYQWLRKDVHHDGLKVSRAGPMELIILLGFVCVGTASLWQALRHVGGSASFWDALTTTLSLAAQWLLNRKRLENWVGWIVVDVIYVPLYLYKELYLTALLYGLFLAMAVMGLRAWRQSWLAQRASRAPAEPLLQASVP